MNLGKKIVYYFKYKIEIFIQFLGFFIQRWSHFMMSDDFWTKSHGPKHNDDEVKLKFFEKKSYTLFYSDLKYKKKTYTQF